MGCPFCATGELGFWRDLARRDRRPGALLARSCWPTGQRLTNVVFMGMGEPLLNTDAVLDCAAALSDPTASGWGAAHHHQHQRRRAGHRAAHRALRPQYTLAVSLHAARPALRDVLVPLNRRYPVHDVVAAATAYADVTGRRVTYEMVMIAGINDTSATPTPRRACSAAGSPTSTSSP